MVSNRVKKRLRRGRSGRVRSMPALSLSSPTADQADGPYNVSWRPYQQRLDAVAHVKHPYPADRYSGKGVVMCAGGWSYFPGAYVCIRMLRRLGCTLPIQVWHLGPAEITADMRSLLEPFGVETVDAFEIRKHHPCRILSGWEVKPYSIIHSRFAEVLFLDADNVPILNPEFLFKTPQYIRTGAIFFPDRGPTAKREIWDICRLQYCQEPEVESGQMVIDKRRCWNALRVAMHMNEYSDFYYRWFHGDKETFHFAWRKIGQEYAMPRRPAKTLDNTTVCQHDFTGRVLFQHRCLRKWAIRHQGPLTEGFMYETECRAFIEELRTQWWLQNLKLFTAEERKLYETVRECRLYTYIAHGQDSQLVEFLPDCTIGRGSDDLAQVWTIRKVRNTPTLQLLRGSDTVCNLRPEGKGRFQAPRTRFNQMPVRLTPVRTCPK